MDDGIFPPTHWSVIQQAAGADPDRARRSFEQLCASYRDAIAHWMRLQRLSPEDADDAAHDFLEQWLRRENPLTDYSRGERRFRDFLRVCLRRYLNDWRDRHRAIRRGGKVEHVPWDHDDVIEDGSESLSQLDYTLAFQIHERILAGMESEWAPQVTEEGFAQLRTVALGEGTNPGYEALALALGKPVGTVKSWVFRLRRVYHTRFRDAVYRQVDLPLVDDEVLYLHGLLFRGPPVVENER